MPQNVKYDEKVFLRQKNTAYLIGLAVLKTDG